jgi:Flp pilus assembly protein TadG
MHALRRLRGCRSGSTSVEFAIISLVLVLVTLGIVEFGRGLNLRNQLSHAADFGARKILTDRNSSDRTLESVVRSAFMAASPDRLKITVGTETVGGVQFRTIALTYPLELLVPGLSDGVINLSLARRTPLVGA